MIIRPKKHKKRKKNRAHKIDEFKKTYIRTINGVEIHAFPNIKPSVAEKKIRNYLRRKDVEYIREVSLGDSKYRFDFLLPRFNFIIEYDGQQYHDSPSAMLTDSIKDKLAKEKGFQVFRLNKTHWAKLSQSVEDVLFKGILNRMYLHYS